MSKIKFNMNGFLQALIQFIIAVAGCLTATSMAPAV